MWSHFSHHFSEAWKNKPVLVGDFKSVRLSDQFHLLEAKFSEEEVWAAVIDCNGNKAPGPDGFNMMFFQKFWKMLKEEVLNFMKEFHSSGRLASGFNSTFITLIPKKEKAITLNEFRPISFVGSVYKILSNVLASRLKKVMPMIIGDSQSAFLGGRNILDGVLVVNEIVDSWLKTKKSGLLFKLDFEKAFDSINWDFLLSNFGFGTKWISWIKECVSTARISILVKGSPIREFYPKKGLRQANFEFGTKWISWIKECVSSARISILVNGSPTKEFHHQKGLRQGDLLSPFLFNLVVEALNILLQRARELNLLKGVVIGNNQAQLSHLQFANDSLLFCEAALSEVLSLKRILRCFEVASGLKINYHKSLVYGVGISGTALAEFAYLLNSKTQSLPLKYLGLPLGAIPKRKRMWKPVVDKFNMRLAGWKNEVSLLCWEVGFSEGVAKEIDKIQASFLWGGPDQKRRIHLVRWTEVTKSIKQGGLGIKRIKDVNVCLLLKWWWRFASDHESLWKRVLCSKYKFLGGSWLPNLCSSNHHSTIWGGTVAAADKQESLSLFYVSNLHMKVGNGCRIKFWYDHWCGALYLKDDFPRLFQLSNNKEGLLKEFVSSSAAIWLFTFRRALFEWEKDELNRLLITVAAPPSLNQGVDDSAVWTALKPDQSLVSNLYNHSNLAFGNTSNSSGLWWARYICKKNERRIWRAIPLVTLWSIWKIINECLFQASQLNTQLLQDLIIIRLAIWLKSSTKDFPFSINDLLFNVSGERHCIRS
ncbi:uncharacterized protein LOC114300778 [Camellia sinensis]|uniref:uncharacterized protein LOC114300778 n=1 Tax=Camellia sinensis TaxID=4442 RepID=UPI00103685DB|nr:uncharacterized protein LOC114300778 [Camellia sinensis]